MAYQEHNKREYELTKNVSLRQLDPIALLELKATGSCEVTLPEWLFDLDGPGHFMRRIKSVSLSIPAVTGPYTSVNCTLSLLRSTLRQSPSGDYKRADDIDDSRFIDYYGTIQSIVTSNAQIDAGMFETNLRDERYLPFEGAGAESTWRIELPGEYRQFDYATIADVILHMRYTAREGGTTLRNGAIGRLRDLTQVAATSGLMQLFSLNHDFPTEWHRFVDATDGDPFSATVRKSYFPYLVQDKEKEIEISSLELYAISDEVEETTVDGIDLATISGNLNDEGSFQLELPADDVVLIRDMRTQAFVIMRYTISAG
jgi:hypothetical protein